MILAQNRQPLLNGNKNSCADDELVEVKAGNL